MVTNFINDNNRELYSLNQTYNILTNLAKANLTLSDIPNNLTCALFLALTFILS
jgi:hypothetical protein